MHPRPPSRVLVADDHAELIDAVRLLLKPAGIDVHAASSPDAALAAIGSRAFDLVLMDLNYTCDTTSGREGIDLLARIQAIDSSLPVVAMTGWGSVELAVEAMRRGVRHFVQKPWDNAALLEMLRTQIDEGRGHRARLAREQRELDEARRIQQKLLPSAIPPMAGIDVAVSWQPAGGVGGDCYDAIALGADRVALSIADVVGKGVPAALLMSSLQATVRAFAGDAVGPAALCRQTNRILCGNIAEDRFISFFYCALDPAARALSYCNAGHYPAMLVRASGALERLETGGVVLGILPEADFQEERVELAAGDRVILFTDGITEARDEMDDEFGEDRLAGLAAEHRGLDAAALQARLLDAVAAFTGGRFHDDATLIVVAVE